MASPQPPSRPKSLDELRARIEERDRKILDLCWAHYRKKGQHPKIRDVYFEFERPNVDDAVNRLTGNLIRRTWGGSTPGEEYQITDLGALASTDGVRLTGLLERYLEALRLLYDANHDVRGINSNDLRPYLDRTAQGFTTEELQDLGRLLVLGVRFLDTNAVGPNADGTWFVNIGENVDDIRRIPDFKAFIQQEFVKAFDPGEPVTEIERANRQHNRPPFWPTADLLTVDQHESDPRRLDEAKSHRSGFTRLIDAMKNHPAVSFVLLMLPVAGGSFGIANLWYSSVISEYRQKIEELSVELSRMQQQILELKKEQRPTPPAKGVGR
jgi:hypothetical protein